MERREPDGRQAGRRYTRNVTKGSMFDECRVLLRAWQPGMEVAAFRRMVVESNLLGKVTRARAGDVLKRAFLARFLSPGAPPAECARKLLLAGAPDGVVNRIIFYHAALADDLLYDFVTEHLYALWQAGRLQVSTADGEAFIDKLAVDGRLAADWTPCARTKVARGLLTVCRDGGLLQGAVKKRFAPVHMPLAVFLYVAHYLKGEVASGSRLVEHRDWRLFLLDELSVERLFLDAHQRGYLGYQAAGGIKRIDWRYANLCEAVDALVERTDTEA